MGDYFAVSLDTYNKKEYIMYSVGDVIVEKERALGEFLFDFSDIPQERENVVDEYLSYFPDADKECLLTERFFAIQKHMKLNQMHRFSASQVLEQISPDNITKVSNKLEMFYIGEKRYVASDYDFFELFRYYLDEIYTVGMFPRICMSCGSLFISAKKHGDVLCSEKCRRKKKSQNTMAYYKRQSECEALYYNLYRKWKQRIDRADKKHTIGSEGIAQLRREFEKLIRINRQRINECKEFVHTRSFQEAHYKELIACDNNLYQLFDELKNNSPVGNQRGRL